MKEWTEKLLEQVFQKYDKYKIVRIDLGIARVNSQQNYPGDFLLSMNTSDGTANFDLRLNRNTNDIINVIRNTEIDTVFDKFFITNAVQAEKWIDLFIGIDCTISKDFLDQPLTVNPIVKVTNVASNVNTVCEARACRQALIKTDVNNVGVVWINFGVAAVQNQTMSLDSGEWVNKILANTSLINVNFEFANDKVFVDFLS